MSDLQLPKEVKQAVEEHYELLRRYQASVTEVHNANEEGERVFATTKAVEGAFGDRQDINQRLAAKKRYNLAVRTLAEVADEVSKSEEALRQIMISAAADEVLAANNN